MGVLLGGGTRRRQWREKADEGIKRNEPGERALMEADEKELQKRF